jgi:hypothetical protein
MMPPVFARCRAPQDIDVRFELSVLGLGYRNSSPQLEETIAGG